MGILSSRPGRVAASACRWQASQHLANVGKHPEVHGTIEMIALDFTGVINECLYPDQAYVAELTGYFGRPPVLIHRGSRFACRGIDRALEILCQDHEDG